MSEFLLRGYNVAIPSVDVGDDVFVVDDQRGTMWRVQVKTGDGKELREDTGETARKIVQYNLSRRQLGELKDSELFFMLMVRWDARWRFALVPRSRLYELREGLARGGPSSVLGAKLKSDTDATTDVLNLTITWTADDVFVWGASLRDCLQWPTHLLPELEEGPGAVRRSAPP